MFSKNSDFFTCVECSRGLDKRHVENFVGETCIWCLGLNETCCEKAVKKALHEVALKYLESSNGAN